MSRSSGKIQDVRGRVVPILHTATEAIRARLEEAPATLPARNVLLADLDVVASMVEGILSAGSSGDDGLSGPPVPAGSRLLELLRAELLEAWPDEGVGGPGAGSTLLLTMRAFEEARHRLAPEGSHLLGAPFLDPWARSLLGEVAHTLGSSFGSMVMLTEILASGESGEVNELQQHQLRILYRAALSLGSTAGDILRLSGPLNEPGEAVRRAFPLDEALEEVEGVLAPILEEKGIGLEVELPSETFREGRFLAVQRILIGLLLAMIAHASPSRISLRIEEEGPEGLRFSLSATGMPEGSDPADLWRVFQERSRRAEGVVEGGRSGGPADDAAPRLRTGGRGWSLSIPALGVASARRLLRSLNAELELSGAEESDLRMSFRLAMPEASRGEAR